MINVKGTAISLPAYMTETAKTIQEKPVKLTENQRLERSNFLSKFKSKLSNALTSNHTPMQNQKAEESSMMAKQVLIMSALERQKLAR